MKNLPKSLIDSAAKLHAKSDGDCKMCAEAERITQFSSRKMFEGLPWISRRYLFKQLYQKVFVPWKFRRKFKRRRKYHRRRQDRKSAKFGERRK